MRYFTLEEAVAAMKDLSREEQCEPTARRSPAHALGTREATGIDQPVAPEDTGAELDDRPRDRVDQPTWIEI
jgi:hypothetical protein